MSASMDHRIGRPGFAVIPVLDLRGGRVVRARRGERSSYAPIETPLAKGSAPDAVARGLVEAWPAAILYVADLDAIIDRAAPARGSPCGSMPASPTRRASRRSWRPDSGDR